MAGTFDAKGSERGERDAGRHEQKAETMTREDRDARLRWHGRSFVRVKRKFLQDNISLVQKVEVVVFLDFALTSESDAMQCGILPNPDRKKWLMTRAKARVRM